MRYFSWFKMIIAAHIFKGMKYSFPTVLIFILCLCKPQVQLVFDTYLNTREYSIISQKQLGSKITVTGVYNEYISGVNSIPAIFIFDESKGIGYVLLQQMLQCPTRSLVTIAGTVAPLTVFYEGTDMKVELPAVYVTDTKVINDLSRQVRIVQSSFHDYYKHIAGKIAAAGSQLRLPLQPDWQMAWMDSEQRLLCYMRCADVMYEAEVDILVDVSLNRIDKIVAWQRFKGE